MITSNGNIFNCYPDKINYTMAYEPLNITKKFLNVDNIREVVRLSLEKIAIDIKTWETDLALTESEIHEKYLKGNIVKTPQLYQIITNTVNTKNRIVGKVRKWHGDVIGLGNKIITLLSRYEQEAIRIDNTTSVEPIVFENVENASTSNANDNSEPKTNNLVDFYNPAPVARKKLSQIQSAYKAKLRLNKYTSDIKTALTLFNNKISEFNTRRLTLDKDEVVDMNTFIETLNNFNTKASPLINVQNDMANRINKSKTKIEIVNDIDNITPIDPIVDELNILSSRYRSSELDDILYSTIYTDASKNEIDTRIENVAIGTLKTPEYNKKVKEIKSNTYESFLRNMQQAVLSNDTEVVFKAISRINRIKENNKNKQFITNEQELALDRIVISLKDKIVSLIRAPTEDPME